MKTISANPRRMLSATWTIVSTAHVLDKIRELRSVVSTTPKPTIQDIKNSFNGRPYQVGDRVCLLEDGYETEFRPVFKDEQFIIEGINEYEGKVIYFDLVNDDGERIYVYPKDVEYIDNRVQDVITALRVSVNDPSVPAEQIMDQINRILKAYENNETIPFEDY